MKVLAPFVSRFGKNLAGGAMELTMGLAPVIAER
jgi:hypothetical protein